MRAQDQEIGEAITVIVVEEHCSRPGEARETGFDRDVHEGPVPFIAIEAIVSIGIHREDLTQAICVVVTKDDGPRSTTRDFRLKGARKLRSPEANVRGEYSSGDKTKGADGECV